MDLAPAALLAKPRAFAPGLVADRLSARETVFRDFKAAWWSTCRAQVRVIGALKEENAAYEDTFISIDRFISIDWDDGGNARLAQDLNTPRRSTLVVLKGEREQGRIVAGTSRADIPGPDGCRAGGGGVLT